LSGFVIHYNYAKVIKDEGLISGGCRFIAARIARLYPLYALALIITLDGLPSGVFHNHQWIELSYISMTQSWFNLEMFSFPPAWSISTEWFFYFAFILLVPFFERISKPFLTFVLFLVISFILLPNLINFQINKYGNANGWINYFLLSRAFLISLLAFSHRRYILLPNMISVKQMYL
jgi:peptidoglycan/LPS O-acetylase OafA/YrhL